MIKLVSSGREPVIAGAVAWLEAKGIPMTLVQSIAVEAAVGYPARLTVTMIVDDPDALAAADYQRVHLDGDQDDLGRSPEDRAPRTEQEFRAP